MLRPCASRMSCDRLLISACRRRRTRRKRPCTSEKLIATKSKKQFTPTKLADKQTDSLLKLVKKKQAKRANVVKLEEEVDTDHKVVDLVKILKQSLGGKGK